jgi:hypothetical protein
VQELARVLFDALAASDLVAQVAAGGAEGAGAVSFAEIIPKLFRGELCDAIECAACGAKRSRAEPFFDLAFPVRGIPNPQAPAASTAAAAVSEGEAEGGGEGATPAAAAAPPAAPPAAAAAAAAPPAAPPADAPFSPLTSLHVALRRALSSETLTGEDALVCDSPACGGARSAASKRAALAAAPATLCCLLRRFGWDATAEGPGGAIGRQVKISDAFSFPFTLRVDA